MNYEFKNIYYDIYKAKGKLLEVQRPYDPSCPSVGRLICRLVGRSVCFP